MRVMLQTRFHGQLIGLLCDEQAFPREEPAASEGVITNHERRFRDCFAPNIRNLTIPGREAFQFPKLGWFQISCDEPPDSGMSRRTVTKKVSLLKTESRKQE